MPILRGEGETVIDQIAVRRDPIDGLDVVMYRENSGDEYHFGEVDISGVSLASRADIRHAVECELGLDDGELDNVLVIYER